MFPLPFRLATFPVGRGGARGVAVLPNGGGLAGTQGGLVPGDSGVFADGSGGVGGLVVVHDQFELVLLSYDLDAVVEPATVEVDLVDDSQGHSHENAQHDAVPDNQVVVSWLVAEGHCSEGVVGFP